MAGTTSGTPGSAPMQPDGTPTEDDAGVLEHVLKGLDLTQAQVATLLGITPQAVSKWIKDDGLSFFAKQGRAQRLYQALSVIGGDRYAMSAARLKDAAKQLNWGVVDSTVPNLVLPADLYAESDELWIVSDSPANLIDWKALSQVLFASANPTGRKVVSFFVKTLESAERWAEVLERELIRPAIQGERIESERGALANCYIYIVVTNAVPYGSDVVIANAGSRCMGPTGSLRPMQAYSWTGSAYAKAGTEAADFVSLAHKLRLGMGALKEHFFPHGDPLAQEILDFGFVFMDGMIAVRGEPPEKDKSLGGDKMAGGILANAVGRPDQTLTFNKRTKFCPVFIQCYRRRPGESFNKNPKKTQRVVQEELERQRKERAMEVDRPAHSKEFW